MKDLSFKFRCLLHRLDDSHVKSVREPIRISADATGPDRTANDYTWSKVSEANRSNRSDSRAWLTGTHEPGERDERLSQTIGQSNYRRWRHGVLIRR